MVFFISFIEITVRNVHNWQDTTIPLSDFISKSRSIATVAEEGGMLSVLYLPTSAGSSSNGS
jgi:hypothetical protein